MKKPTFVFLTAAALAAAAGVYSQYSSDQPTTEAEPTAQLDSIADTTSTLVRVEGRVASSTADNNRLAESGPVATPPEPGQMDNPLESASEIISSGTPEQKQLLAWALASCRVFISIDQMGREECEAVYADPSLLAYEDRLAGEAIDGGYPVAVALDAYERLAEDREDIDAIVQLEDLLLAGEGDAFSVVAGVRGVDNAGNFDAVEYTAWLKAAASFGYDTSDEAIRDACARQGCPLSSNQIDFVAFHHLAPADSIRAQQLYESIMEAISRGDLSNIDLFSRQRG